MNYNFFFILQEVIDKRRKLLKEFEEYRSKRLVDWNKQKAERMAIRNRKSNVKGIFYISVTESYI